MKKILVLILVMLVMNTTCTVGFAAGPSVPENIKLLHTLGILEGSDGTLNSIDIQKPVTRLTAAIVQLKLLGLEETASVYTGNKNYADVSKTPWARHYLAYIYDHPELGWVTNQDNFDSFAKISGEELTEIMLSILKETKYTESAVKYANQIGIRSAKDSSIVNMSQFANIVAETLNVKVNETKTALAEYLVEQNVLDREVADAEGIVKNMDGNILTVAVAWKQTAAEYKALYYQGFNQAKAQLQVAIANQKPGDKPLAIITDVDDTIVSPVNYWGYLIQNKKDFFNDEIWDKWIPENKMVPTPGSLEFLNFCKENNVEVFYVTSRDQGEKTYEYALGNLQALGFPYADKEHLNVLQDTSNKEKPQMAIAEKYNVSVYLGDNLNDFRRIYYVKDIDERTKLMEADKELFGSKFILFPNPTDGHWVRAIFGESEPAPANENREIWENAAQKSTWSPQN
ncbi:MAG: HAD family acid phosphatase [Anaerovorax sp.]|nr:HAD family acid phosphatase [Anaerovorax sp.]